MSSPPPPSLPRLALYGTFDVLNYGDLLFPHLVRHALGPDRHDCVAVSPTRGQLPWADTVPTVAVAEAPQLGAALHLVGGGNIIHLRQTPLPDYDAAFGGRDGAYPSLWLGAALIAAQSGARLAWNAPGLPAALPGGEAAALRDMALAASDYVSLRDAASLAFLGGASAPRPAVLPDTALDLSRVWPAATLRGAALAAFARHGLPVPAAWTVFHLNDRYLDGEPAEIATQLRAIAGTSLPVLLALGPCHGDDALARRIGAVLGPAALVLDRPAGLREIAGLIAHAEAYAGSSLHGLITALSYGRPALVVARPQMVKFDGFLSQLGMGERLLTGWREAAAAAPRLLRPLGPAEIAAIGEARDLIGQHWSRLRGLMTGAAGPAAMQGRARLQQWMQAGPGPTDWRAFTRVLPAAIPVPSAEPVATPACNICGQSGLRPGPASLLDQIGGGAACLGCGATARHRAMRVVIEALRQRGPARGRCLRFGRNRVLAGGWFAELRDLDAAAPPALPPGGAGVVACIDMLERAPDPAALLQAMLAAVEPGGFLFLALRNVPGYARTLDWGFPRGDREGEYRKFGEDAAALIRAALPTATILEVEPADPVTGLRSRVYLAAHDPQALARLPQTDLPQRTLPQPGAPQAQA
jgi:hypothetical protein